MIVIRIFWITDSSNIPDATNAFTKQQSWYCSDLTVLYKPYCSTLGISCFNVYLKNAPCCRLEVGSNSNWMRPEPLTTFSIIWVSLNDTCKPSSTVWDSTTAWIIGRVLEFSV